MSAVWTGVIVLWAVAAWFALTKVIPSCSVSLFRYRLWRIRDDLVDAIGQGAFTDDAAPKKLVADIEVFIRAAPDVNIITAGLHRWIGWGMDLSPDGDPFDFERAPKADRALLQKYADRFQGAFAKQVLLGRPSGWLLLVVFAPSIAGIVLVSQIKNRSGYGSFVRETKSHMRDEIHIEPALELLRERSPDGRTVSLV